MGKHSYKVIRKRMHSILILDAVQCILLAGWVICYGKKLAKQKTSRSKNLLTLMLALFASSKASGSKAFTGENDLLVIFLKV